MAVSYTYEEALATARLTSEQAILAAITRQALKDATSRHRAIRHEARCFLRDTATVASWAELAGLDPPALLTRVVPFCPATRRPATRHAHHAIDPGGSDGQP
jgi:hypothetical protein